MPALYAFKSQDSMAQFSAGVVSSPAILMAVFFFVVTADWVALLVTLLMVVIFMVGFRASISVAATEVVVIKKWFFIRYKTYRASAIKDVFFGGDWGLEEGAIGVVVQLGGNEVHIGTRKNMRKIRDALWPLCLEYNKFTH